MKIAVFLPGWIGDVVMATAALRALRHHFRGARIVGVAKPYVAGVLEGSAWLDDLILYNGGRGSQGVCATAWQLRRQGTDLAVLFPNSFRSALTAWLGGCARRVGYARHSRSWLLTDALDPVRDGRGRIVPSPVLDDYNRLARHVGCGDVSHRLELYTTAEDEARAQQVWEMAGLGGHPEVVLLNPGAAYGSAKHWPVGYFAALARDLAQLKGCGVLVLAGPAELAMCRAIAAQAGHRAVHALADYLAPTCPEGPGLSLGLIKSLVRRGDLLVTTDSGPRHFAAAFDRPVVTLFGPTHIAWTETYHPLAAHLQKQVSCGPCQRRVCPLDHRCMTLLTPGEVYKAAEDLLAKGSSRKAG